MSYQDNLPPSYIDPADDALPGPLPAGETDDWGGEEED